MDRMIQSILGFVGVLFFMSGHLSAQSDMTEWNGLNMPIVQTKYTADPAPLVYKDTIYLYTSHDEDNADGFLMRDWLLYTSTDMVNWQDRGTVASLRDFKWFKRDNGAWASSAVCHNGKWYLYCTTQGQGIGVLTSDSPYGPFSDPLGKPLVWQTEIWDDIDPSVFVDDDGQAYMYWGNPNLYYVKLNEDMISYSGDIVKLPHIEDYQEGPFIYKRGAYYYLAFASTCCPEGIGYAMSNSPTGPWIYKGHIMDHTIQTRGNHPGIIDYKGKSYCFGQNNDILRLSTAHQAERRSVAVAEMTYCSDGSIQELPYFLHCQLKQVESFNPYRQVEAETMAWGYGLKTLPKDAKVADRWNQLVSDIDDGEYILIKGVNFNQGTRSFLLSASAHLFGGTLEIHIDAKDGSCIGIVNITNTQDEFHTFETTLEDISGIHDLYLVFHGGKVQKKNLFFLDWWKIR